MNVIEPKEGTFVKYPFRHKAIVYSPCRTAEEAREGFRKAMDSLLLAMSRDWSEDPRMKIQIDISVKVADETFVLVAEAKEVPE